MNLTCPHLHMWTWSQNPKPCFEAMNPNHATRVAECHGSCGYIRIKKWLNVEKLGNFNGGKSLFKCFLRVNYLTFCNSACNYWSTPLPRNLMWRKRDLGNHMGDTTPHAHDPTHTQDMTTHNKCSLPLIHQVVAPGRTGRSVVWFPSYRCAQKLCS